MGQSDYPDDPSEYSAEKTIGDMVALLDTVGAKIAINGGHLAVTCRWLFMRRTQRGSVRCSFLIRDRLQEG
jgi:hypothetical protein